MKFVLDVLNGLFKAFLIWLLVCLWHWLSPDDMPYFSLLQCFIFQSAVAIAQEWDEEEHEGQEDAPN